MKLSNWIDTAEHSAFKKTFKNYLSKTNFGLPFNREIGKL
jgi:hypothetical protein